MRNHLLTIIAITCLCAGAWVQAMEFKFPKHASAVCGEATIEIRVSVPENESFPPFEKVAFSAANATKRFEREFFWEGGSHDTFNAMCFHTGNNGNYIVFQFNCLGSGCGDGDQLGIIDVQSLEVLLTPHKFNRPHAKRILGEEPPFPESDKNTFFKMELVGTWQ